MAGILLLWIGIFIVSLAALIKAADYFTDHSEKIGLIIGISPFIIGITIVSIGTSLPELASSVASVIQGQTEIVAGNAIGSNIANILLVLGVAAIAGKALTLKRSLINLDGPLLLAATALFGVVAVDGTISLIDALILLTGYGVYLGYTLLSHKGEGEKPSKSKPKKGLGKSTVIVVISATAVAVAAKYTIDSVTRISEILNIGTSVIALSAVAIGTSLPELLVSVKAALKGKHEIALGNVFGSNLFNILAVTGVPALIKPLALSPETLFIAGPFVIIATILFVISGISNKIHNWEGMFYLLIYVVFIGKLFHII